MDRFESGTVLGGLGYGGKPLHKIKEEIKVKKIVCSCFGNIYYATILKDGLMSDVNRVDVTDDAIDAVLQHIISMDKFDKEGFA